MMRLMEKLDCQVTGTARRRNRKAGGRRLTHSALLITERRRSNPDLASLLPSLPLVSPGLDDDDEEEGERLLYA
ncbi:hypothetical protein E2C01_026326 [Portunus trituberculatus]|uniref:Uncharacterized protein n=1 Tax=Portunus trituberculatus TaxID=210409 RepID=A0A5B7EHZ3_PORTR|nr:hypothetical protein [Portunus trituberculatus]